MELRYFLNGQELTRTSEDAPPARGDEVCIDGRYYLVARLVRHIVMIPPYPTHVHLVVGAAPVGESAHGNADLSCSGHR